ncbi:iron-siderophore ABC transporter substrate-binding protein [Streptomyces sp. VNUA116]|uniref:ABC transporter substrate-binding protein n=1 Tax=Streptomyces sp. VNUA116 TaxID=3062449 RepID=UPI00267560A0|nr:iron-siderophore ABC transporter substrate-binding protein [Streptomyces sp. VNUA116]WKU44157.1 iron-siderophore ABC transporter substrate-binding protein [Streptomyces sp. VNUA116]
MTHLRPPLRRLRRVPAALLTVIMGAAVLAGCGGDDETKDEGKAGAATGFPRTVTHAMGTTEIKKKPERVVVLDTGELDDVTMLGIEPVGAVSPHMKTEGGFPQYLSAKTKDTKDVGPMAEPNIERIISLKPDLILSSKVRHAKVYDRLKGIAPTVFTETTGAPWKENLKVHAQALGLEKEAQAAMSAYEKRAKALGGEIKKKNNGTMPTASVVRFVAGPTRLYQKASFSGIVLSDIGLRRPASQDVDAAMTDVPAEQLDKADADLVFVTVADDPKKTQQGAVQANPLWKGLGAVKNDKVVQVPDETWMSGIGIQAANHVVDDIAKAAGVDAPE